MSEKAKMTLDHARAMLEKLPDKPWRALRRGDEYYDAKYIRAGDQSLRSFLEANDGTGLWALQREFLERVRTLQVDGEEQFHFAYGAKRGEVNNANRRGKNFGYELARVVINDRNSTRYNGRETSVVALEKDWFIRNEFRVPKEYVDVNASNVRSHNGFYTACYEVLKSHSNLPPHFGGFTIRPSDKGGAEVRVYFNGSAGGKRNDLVDHVGDEAKAHHREVDRPAPVVASDREKTISRADTLKAKMTRHDAEAILKGLPHKPHRVLRRHDEHNDAKYIRAGDQSLQSFLERDQNIWALSSDFLKRVEASEVEAGERFDFAYGAKRGEGINNAKRRGGDFGDELGSAIAEDADDLKLVDDDDWGRRLRSHFVQRVLNKDWFMSREFRIPTQEIEVLAAPRREPSVRSVSPDTVEGRSQVLFYVACCRSLQSRLVDRVYFGALGGFRIMPSDSPKGPVEVRAYFDFIESVRPFERRQEPPRPPRDYEAERKASDELMLELRRWQEQELLRGMFPDTSKDSEDDYRMSVNASRRAYSRAGLGTGGRFRHG